ncbi:MULTISPECIES: fimbrial protein [Pseudomonas]|uniref:fimbrial protein n=2 Tax=Pseudomonas TaxID=286 RepID=UPI000C6C8C4B|nr:MULTISPECIES: fimbrial protein [Pseudomonas]MDD1977357.1 fimbrial protein [Pseudomonas putida]MDH2560623.1 fimbrial protein [Pseudomonas sp. Hg5Tf]QYX46448.1 fimbrial protein [Pseudomonas sp. S11A 273]
MTPIVQLKHLVTPVIVLALGLASDRCLAGTDVAMANITGSITQPACKFNLGNSLDVKFTDVDVSKIATGQYSVPIDLNVTCGNEAASITLKLTGTPGYSPDVINTDVEGLGIKLTNMRLGTVWQANTSIKTTAANNNTILATLTALPGTQFTGGEFSASVSISANYD